MVNRSICADQGTWIFKAQVGYRVVPKERLRYTPTVVPHRAHGRLAVAVPQSKINGNDLSVKLWYRLSCDCGSRADFAYGGIVYAPIPAGSGDSR